MKSSCCCPHCGKNIVLSGAEELESSFRSVVRDELGRHNTNNVKAIPSLLTMDEVLSITHISRSLLYLMMSENRFPRPFNIGKRKVRWSEEHVKQWLDSREQQDSDETKRLWNQRRGQ